MGREGIPTSKKERTSKKENINKSLTTTNIPRTKKKIDMETKRSRNRTNERGCQRRGECDGNKEDIKRIHRGRTRLAAPHLLCLAAAAVVHSS